MRVLDATFLIDYLDGVEATLLVGGDDDYDGVTDIEVERFRDGGA